MTNGNVGRYIVTTGHEATFHSRHSTEAAARVEAERVGGSWWRAVNIPNGTKVAVASEASVMAIGKVNIEASAHQQLRELIQRLADEHGLIVLRVSVDWMEFGSVGMPRAIVNVIDMDTRTRG